MWDKWERERERLSRALRWGIALGLAVAGLWMAALTADPGAVSGALTGLGQKPGLALTLLSAQMGYPADLSQYQALTGQNRLLLQASPLLAAGEEGILALQQQESSTPPPEFVEEQGEIEPEIFTTPEDNGAGLDYTAGVKEGDGAIALQGVSLYNRSGLAFDPEGVSPILPELAAEGPQILILHTHGSEAYTPTEADPYEPSDPYRTTDCTKNIVKVGEEMAMVFRAHGFRVIHDTNLYDYPSYSGAYDRSKAAVEQWLKQYPSISIVLDVHRDALSAEDGTPYRLITTEVGRQAAQVMLVVGTNGGGSSHTQWKKNLSFALFLQQKMEKGFDALARPMVLRSASFNQQLVVPGYLLVEVGGHGNTLADAIEGARFWADTAARGLRSAETS
jgi:stage II sporulation protein P